MGAKSTPELEAKKVKIREMWGLGWSSGEIARQIKSTRGCVIGHVHRMDLPKRVTAMSIPRSIIPKPLPEKPVEPISRGLGLEDLLTGMCRWPTGHGPSVTFCGQHIEQHKPYCAFHCGLAFQKPLARIK